MQSEVVRTRHWAARIMAAAVMLAVAVPSASATTVVAVDADPGMAGIQNSRTVFVGSAFTVDVVIMDVTDLNAFQLDLGFDPVILSATSAALGSFLLPPALLFVDDVAPPAVNLAAVTLSDAGASGGGVLASIDFSALAVGNSLLDLSNVLLSAPFGQPIVGFDLVNASIEVRDQGPVVPLPPAILLFASALAGGAGLGLRRRRSIP